MRRSIFPVVSLFLACALAHADAPGKVIEDRWEAAYLNGAKSGYVHTSVEDIGQDGEGRLRARLDMHLSAKRFNDPIKLQMLTGDEETPDGRVTAVEMGQFLGKNQTLRIVGQVDGDRLRVSIAGQNPRQKVVPWDKRVIGLYKQERLYRERNVQPGDRFEYRSYEPTIVSVVTTRVRIADWERVTLPGLGRQRLLRADVTTDQIQGVQLPPLTLWLDEDRGPVASQVEIPGLGKLTLCKATKAVALRPSSGGPAQTDLGFDQFIRINRAIPNSNETRDAVYRIRLKGDNNAGTAFARDGRQEVRDVHGDRFELHVHAAPPPPQADAEASPPSPEFLESCYFIKSDDPAVRKLARQAVGQETDPWEKAKRIERWVHDHMRSQNFTENFATADHVARTLEGDCTEHAVLAAAMCRAEGVPARTAVGLVYVDGSRGPCFGFHMWAEVWAGGRWVPIDATLGRGYVGATHLKVLDHSWHDVQSFTPLLPLLRVVGKASIEVVSIDGEH